MGRCEFGGATPPLLPPRVRRGELLPIRIRMSGKTSHLSLERGIGPKHVPGEAQGERARAQNGAGSGPTRYSFSRDATSCFSPCSSQARKSSGLGMMPACLASTALSGERIT